MDSTWDWIDREMMITCMQRHVSLKLELKLRTSKYITRIIHTYTATSKTVNRKLRTFMVIIYIFFSSNFVEKMPRINHRTNFKIMALANFLVFVLCGQLLIKIGIHFFTVLLRAKLYNLFGLNR